MSFVGEGWNWGARDIPLPKGFRDLGDADTPPQTPNDGDDYLEMPLEVDDSVTDRGQ